MKLAKDFLEKFKRFTPPDHTIRRAVADAVRDHAGVPLTAKDVSLSHGVAFVRSSSVAKSAIRARRAEILAQIFSVVPKARDSVRDIR